MYTINIGGKIMDDRSIKFHRFEKIFFRIQLAFLAISISIYLLYLAIIELLGPFVDYIMTVILIGIIGSMLNFVISVIRIIIFVLKHRSEELVSIWRSVLNLILSPLSIIIFYVMIFITAATSCAYGG